LSEATEREYVLGTDEAEIARLSLQHSVWRADAARAWQRAGFAPGQSIVDVGCGPGFATLDLAELVGPRGRVLAIDQSVRFLEYLRRVAAAHGLSEVVKTTSADVTEAALPAGEFDGAWIRWVLSFVGEPRAVVNSVANALRPGGVLAVHEYCDYRTWRFFPRDEEHDEYVEHVMASWRKRGGDPDVGFSLPVMLREAGLEVRHVRAISEIVEPGSPRWAWAMAFARTGMERLVGLGDVPRETGDRLNHAIERIAGAAQLMAIPTVAEVIAVKPGA
jgi:SAM-dependent methyltransferase